MSEEFLNLKCILHR